MSYPIFPTVDTTRASGFNWKLPLKVSPQFKTLVQTPANNRGELRISLAQYPIWTFDMDVAYLFGDPDVLNDGFQKLIGLYGQCQGAASPFLFDWPGNDSVVGQQIGVGDGTTVVFQMTHTIGGLTELIQNFQTSPSVYVNGVLQTGGAFAIDSYGNLTLASAPAVGLPITWTGSWYYLCRFVADELQELQQIRGNGSSSLWTLKSLKFKSVLL